MALRGVMRAREWSAEQHEAVAAALGDVVLQLLAMPPMALGTGNELHSGMDVQKNLIAKWLAIDSATHAEAAEEERNRMAIQLGAD